MMRTKIMIGALLVLLTMMFSSSVNGAVNVSLDAKKATMNSQMIETALQKAKSSKSASEKIVTLPKGVFFTCKNGGCAGGRDIAWCKCERDANIENTAE